MTQQVIALVDDDPAIVAMLDDLLGGEGYGTFVISVSEGAPTRIAEAMPDLVILDLWMETQDAGWAVYDAVRADAATACIPVIVCSADIASLRTRAAELAARGDGAVEKPFEIAALLAMVGRLIGPA